MGTGQIWRAMSSKKCFTKRQTCDLFHEFYRWPKRKKKKEKLSCDLGKQVEN